MYNFTISAILYQGFKMRDSVKPRFPFTGWIRLSFGNANQCNFGINEFNLTCEVYKKWEMRLLKINEMELKKNYLIDSFSRRTKFKFQ